MSDLKTETTTEYPTRYAAFDRCRVLFVAAAPVERGGFEAAVYANLMRNARFPHIESDGVYVEVIGLAKAKGQGVRAWLVDGQASTPDAKRTQKVVSRQHATREAAIADAALAVAELEAWVAATTEPLPVPVPVLGTALSAQRGQ